MQMKKPGVFLLCLFLYYHQLGCTSTIKINFDSLKQSSLTKKEQKKSVRSFTHHDHYGLFGLIGTGVIYARKACMGDQMIRIKNHFNLEDVLFSVPTLGLFTPKSTRIWCKENKTDRPDDAKNSKPLDPETKHIPPNNTSATDIIF